MNPFPSTRRSIHLLRYLKKCRLQPFEPEISLVRQFIEQDTETIDVGANTGLYTEELGRHAAAVYAFEPDEGCFAYLSAVKGVNWRVENLAASDVSGVSVLRTPIVRSAVAVGYGTLSTKNDFDMTEHEGVHVQSVKTTSLDDYFSAGAVQTRRISFVKIDVEGFEFSVVKGAVDIMKEHKPVFLIECEYRHSDEIPAMFEFFLVRGYSAARLDATAGRKLRAVSCEDLRRSQTADQLARKLATGHSSYINNVFFLPPGTRKQYLTLMENG